MTAKRPNSMRHLDDAIRRECGGGQGAYVRLRTVMANAIVAQLLPDGVVKGGSALKMRYGNAATRYTTDLDTATATDPDAYVGELGVALDRGWEGFTGRVVARRPAHPRGVPDEYVRTRWLPVPAGKRAISAETSRSTYPTPSDNLERKPSFWNTDNRRLPVPI